MRLARTRRRRVVRLSRMGASDASRYASRAVPHETGGILLGWRTEEAIEVVDVLEVPDPNARLTSYERRHQPAEVALAAALDFLPSESEVGYVGEWHSHCASARHSRQDRRELRALSVLSENPLALIVFARHHGMWVPHALSARGGNVARAIVVETIPMVARHNQSRYTR